MDKKQLFAEGKKNMEEQHNSSGENITPKARPAAAYSAAICIGVLTMAGTGEKASGNKKMVLQADMTGEERKKTSMSKSFVYRFRVGNDKKSRGAKEASQEVMQHTRGEEVDKEETSHGAAGQLTRAGECACQEP
jgi:hypothetical protein